MLAFAICCVHYSIALEELLYVASSHRRGPSPAFSRRVNAPLGPHSSSLRGSRRSDRPRSPSHDRSRSRDAFSGHPRPSRRSHERYEERAVPSDAPAHRRRPRARDSPSLRQLDFPSKSPSPHQKRFASQRSPSSSRERFASRRSSSPKRMRVAPDVPYQEHHDSRRFLRFVVAGKTYQFRVLCFGLTTAPQVFTRIMAPVSAILHRHGVTMLRYLDDWLILASTEIACIQSRDRLLAVCKELGIQVNFKKSSLVPTQSLVYLGMEIQSLPFIARPTPARANNLVRLIEEFLSTPSPPAFLWRRLLGHLSSLILLVSGGMIRMRLLQLCLKDQWDFLDDQFQVSWSPLCREDLLWWSRVVQLREGVSLSIPAPDISFFSDASDVGWGALVGEHHASGLWLPHQKALSINMRELLAVQLGLQAFEFLLVGMSVALFCDNTTTVAYLRRSGGTFSATLNATALEILLWAENRRIRLLPQFIMGSTNVTADALSRPNQVIGSEWTLHQEVVDQLVHQWPAVIDLFATSLTARLPVYFSPASDPRAEGTDALLQSWDDLQAYAFPPIAIIRRVLLKLRSSKNCELTLIAPFWPQRDWFPDLLELLSDVPVTLSGRRDLLRQPHFHRFHLNLPMLQLTAWRLSSDSPSKPASLLRWLDSLSSVEDCPRT